MELNDAYVAHTFTKDRCTPASDSKEKCKLYLRYIYDLAAIDRNKDEIIVLAQNNRTLPNVKEAIMKNWNILQIRNLKSYLLQKRKF